MTCKHCCGADQLFDQKGAKKEMKKYKKKGSQASTTKLLSHLLNHGVQEKTLLDIGGGIGAIQWAFLENGGSKSTDVDASLNYLTIAESYAKEIGLNEKASFFHGDFVDLSGDINGANFVTLDKVICCYPDYQSLLENSLKKCNNFIGIVYPLGGPISKLFTILESIYFRIKHIEFRTFIHSPKEIESFILKRGFKVAYKSISFPWHIQVYERVE